MPARYSRVHLVVPTHQIFMPGTSRLFNQGPDGEVVDITDSFWDALIADGSLALGEGTEPAPQPDRPSPDIVGESPILVDYDAAVRRFIARLDQSVSLVALDAGAGVAITQKGPNWYLIESADSVLGTTLSVDLVTTDAISIPHPKIGAGATAPMVASVPLWDGARIGALNQASAVDNGPWIYDAGTNTLSRPADYAPGLVLTYPFYLEAADNDDAANSGTVWQVVRQTGALIVGTSPTQWSSVAAGAGRYSANQVLAGPWQPGKRPYQASPRGLAPSDQPLYCNSQSITTFPQSPYVALRTARTSRFVSAVTPWKQSVAISSLLADYRAIEVDKAIYLYARPTLLSGRKIVFNGSGTNGPVRVFVMNPGANVFLFNGLHDIDIEGQVVIEYVFGCNAGISAFKISDSVANIKIGSLWTKGVDYALEVSHGTMRDLTVGELGVDNPATESPLRLLAPGTVSGHATIRIGRLAGVAATLAAPDANFSFVALSMPSAVAFNTLTANRTVTLSTTNLSEGYEVVFANFSGSGFSVTIGALGVIANGQMLRARVSNGAWVRVS